MRKYSFSQRVINDWNKLSYSFSQRVINDWNKLSNDCVNASSVNMLKIKLTDNR